MSKIIVIAAFGLISAANSAAGVWFVDINSTASPGDGLSWTKAFRTIQEGIDASFAKGGGEVWVAEGTYGEARNSPMHSPAVDTGSIVMKENVHLYGGFIGIGAGGFETTRAQRDWKTHVVTINGGKARNGLPAYHVVVGAGNATLDGFTVTGADASAAPTQAQGGGGILNVNASPTVRNCIITANTAQFDAGMANGPNASPIVVNCTISNNHAKVNSGGMGNWDRCYPYILDCVFEGNISDRMGGGLLDGNYSSSTIVNCLFRNNTSVTIGAGICNYQNGAPTVVNCIFTNNTVAPSSWGGGGIGVWHPTTTTTTTTIINCTFSSNSGSSGSGVYTNNKGPVTITNSILWNGSGAEISGAPVVTYSDVTQKPTGTGNISADPLFVVGTTANFHLSATSPCIDTGTAAGSPTFDFASFIRPVDITGVGADGPGTGYEMGAYEFGSSAAPYTLRTVVQGNGQITPAAGSHFYTAGTPAQITATIPNGWEFVRWEGDLAGRANPTTITMDGDKIVRAVFMNKTLDSDGDGLPDVDEILAWHTNPWSPDTDGDGMPDGFEVLYRLDPSNPADANEDADGDGLANIEEFQLRSNPRDAASPRATFYVSATSGTNAIAGGTQARPWKTVTYALAQIAAAGKAYAIYTTGIVMSGVYQESVHLPTNVALVGQKKMSPTAAPTIIEGTVVGADGSGLHDVEIHEPATAGANGVLLSIDNARMVLRDVTLQGNANRTTTGIEISGPRQSTITACTFNSLAVGMRIAGALPILARSDFDDLAQNAIVIDTSSSPPRLNDGSMGDVTNPNTGYNWFGTTGANMAVVNNTGVLIKMEYNEWGVLGAAARISGLVDAAPALDGVTKRNLEPAILICALWDATTLEPVTNAAVKAQASAAPPPLLTVTENALGIYTFMLIPKNYTISATATGYASPASQLIEAGSDAENQVSVPMTASTQGPTDSDGDGLPDSVETNTRIFVDATRTGTDPHNPDTDGDGISDGVEVAYGTNPCEADANLTADVNGDLVINAVDVQLVINAALGLPVEGNADINRDGKEDAIDVQLVINGALGLL